MLYQVAFDSTLNYRFVFGTYYLGTVGHVERGFSYSKKD